MGVTARGLHPIVGLVALGQTLTDLGASVDLGAGVQEAMRELTVSQELHAGTAEGVTTQ